MDRIERLTAPLGMVGVVFYLLHTILGRVLWPAYDPITTDISSLTAVGAPNRSLLMIFTAVYGVATLLFVAGMLVKAARNGHALVRLGWGLLLVMNLISMFGYALFPLSGDKGQMTFGNAMHVAVTVAVVFTSIAAGYILAVGFLRQGETRKLGAFTLVMAIIITATGALNPIGMANHWNILGLTERAVIYSLQGMMFVFSAYYTFSTSEKVGPNPPRSQKELSI